MIIHLTMISILVAMFKPPMIISFYSMVAIIKSCRFSLPLEVLFSFINDMLTDHSTLNLFFEFLFSKLFLFRQEGYPVIGLTLRISESLIKKIELNLAQENQHNNHQDVLSQPQPLQKLKASNIPALFLRIGSWRVRYLFIFTFCEIYSLLKLTKIFNLGSGNQKTQEIWWSNSTTERRKSCGNFFLDQ